MSPRATIKELLETVFLRGLWRDVINGTSLEFSSVVRRWPSGNGVSAEAKESLLLRSVTGKRLVKTSQAGKLLACAVVICKL
jgi:hypothetical protein